jgi:hypothetical protein
MAEDSRSRKGLLRYHQPPESSAPSYYAYPPPPVPCAIQSASASPRHSSVTLPPVLPPARWFLGLVIRQVLPYLTTRVTHAEWRYRSLSPPCGKRRLVQFFWLHLPMRVLPESTTITLHPHIPLIIIGVEDVAFNRFRSSCLGLHATPRTTGT